MMQMLALCDVGIVMRHNPPPSSPINEINQMMLPKTHPSFFPFFISNYSKPALAL